MVAATYRAAEEQREGEKHYKEGGVATLSVYDRRGGRLGTLYLAEMPQPMQVTLAAELTVLSVQRADAWEWSLAATGLSDRCR